MDIESIIGVPYTSRTAYINALVAYCTEMVNRAPIGRRERRAYPYFGRKFARQIIPLSFWRDLSDNFAAQRNVTSVVVVHARQYANLISEKVSADTMKHFFFSALNDIYIAKNGVDRDAWQAFVTDTKATCEAWYAADHPDANEAERALFDYAMGEAATGAISAEVWHTFRDNPDELEDLQDAAYDLALENMGTLRDAAQSGTLV